MNELGQQARDEGLATHLALHTPFPYDAWLPVVRRLMGYGMSDKQIEVTGQCGLPPHDILTIAAFTVEG